VAAVTVVIAAWTLKKEADLSQQSGCAHYLQCAAGPGSCVELKLMIRRNWHTAAAAAAAAATGNAKNVRRLAKRHARSSC
jgi:hypothetical protein